jgi:polysaccharide export outer membrane protein
MMKKFKNLRWVIFLAILTNIASCIPNRKVIYLQNNEKGDYIGENELVSYDYPEYRLQYNDIIDVKILTTEDLISEAFSTGINSGNRMMGGMMGMNGGDIFYLTGFTIDVRGNVILPIVGEVNIAQLTIDEARLVIEKKLKMYLTSDFFLRIKLGGIRFSSIGEFKHPGKYTVLQDRMTIFEAIAASGDLTLVAKRDEVLLIRQYPDGTKIHKVNLMDRQIIRSPFYFIQPNDQLYAEPMKVRELGSGENAAQTISLLISSMTALALILNFTTR